jgi:lipopolysaccharide export system ATP-binding protein
MTAVLASESIGKSYGRTRVLSSARLEARAGALTFVTGRNGAGKSTLLKISAGVVQPDHGAVHFRGEILTRPRLHRLARMGLFYLADRDLLSPSFSVRDQLRAMQARFSGPSLETVTEELKIAGVIDHRPWELSGGERRRAELALGLMRDPVCMIADEPLRGIDPKDRDQLVSAFRGLADRGAAVVVSGHETQSLLGASDEIVWVTSGTTYSLGPPEAALEQERFRREYLTGSWV